MYRTLLAIVILTAPALGQPTAVDTPPAATQPPATTQPADGAGSLSATVTSVAGPAQFLDASADDATWQPLQQGQVLGADVVIRTGFGARVELAIADRGEVVIDGVAKIGLGRLAKSGQQAEANIGLKYGRIRARVRPEAGPSDVEVTTPVATLSVRGSEADICYLVGNRVLVRASSGKWRVSKRYAGRLGSGWLRRLMLIGGQSTNNQLQSPDRLRLLLWDTELMDKFGSTMVERVEMAQNGRGRRYGNPPPGRPWVAPATRVIPTPTPPAPQHP